MQLAAELQCQIARQLGAGATIHDWIAISEVCTRWRDKTQDWFIEWLREQAAGSMLCEWTGNDAECVFVRRHLEGERGEKTFPLVPTLLQGSCRVALLYDAL